MALLSEEEKKEERKEVEEVKSSTSEDKDISAGLQIFRTPIDNCIAT